MTEIPQQLLTHFTSEWQKVAIVSAFIILVLTVGLVEVCKRLETFDFLDQGQPDKAWKRNVMRFAFWLGFGWSVLLMPPVVDGTHYEVAVKTLVIACANGIAALLGFDTIKWALKLFKAYVIEWVRAKVRKKLIEEPSKRGDDVDYTSTLVKWANGRKDGKP
jgi:hypothetical protein